jgi:hypothetical protein
LFLNFGLILSEDILRQPLAQDEGIDLPHQDDLVSSTSIVQTGRIPPTSVSRKPPHLDPARSCDAGMEKEEKKKQGKKMGMVRPAEPPCPPNF